MRSFWLIFLWISFFSAEGQNHVSSADFYEKMNNNKEANTILDVRLYEEYLDERIPGAIYAGEKEVLLELISDISKESLILVYCEYGERSKTVLEILNSRGFQKIYHLENGYLEWKQHDFPVDDTNII